MRLSQNQKSIFLLSTLAILALGINPLARAVTDPYRPAMHYTTDPAQLRVSLQLPVTDNVVMLPMPYKKLLVRMKNAPSDDRIEPVTILIPTQSEALVAFADKLAQAGKEKQLLAYFKKRIHNHLQNADRTQQAKVKVALEAAPYIDGDALARLFDKPHHDVVVQTSELESDHQLKERLLHQTRDFLSDEERSNLVSKLQRGENLHVDTDLLPDFPRRMIRKYIVFRGPNCFHAALAFHSTNLSDSPFINVKREAGYHAAMINYDELWRAITEEFYEVDAARAPLKYGDMIVFFDSPKDGQPVNYKTIRHTATYLFGAYTFSKGSKSPDTPYSVKTVDEEWRTWAKFTSSLGVKVFRRAVKNVKKVPPTDLIDWVY